MTAYTVSVYTVRSAPASSFFLLLPSCTRLYKIPTDFNCFSLGHILSGILKHFTVHNKMFIYLYCPSSSFLLKAVYLIKSKHLNGLYDITLLSADTIVLFLQPLQTQLFVYLEFKNEETKHDSCILSCSQCMAKHFSDPCKYVHTNFNFHRIKCQDVSNNTQRIKWLH